MSPASRLRQGQSVTTIDKERRIAAAMAVGMRIANARFSGSGFKFWHFDANAGSGWNDAVDVPGSPLVFWKVARECLPGMQPAPFFCDFDSDAMGSLKKRFATGPEMRTKSILLPGDNEDALEVFAECIRRSERADRAIGALVIDPNGYFYRDRNGSGAPVNAARWFCQEFPRIDLILNLNMRTYHMQAAHQHQVVPPWEVLDSLARKYWLLARAGAGQSRFLLAIGRNVKTGDHRSLGLHERDSEMGQLILSAAMAKRQQDLPYELSELPRIPRASGFSGRSGSRDAPGEGIVRLRGESDGSAPLQRLSALGNVRRAGKPAPDLSHLPLFGARQG